MLGLKSQNLTLSLHKEQSVQILIINTERYGSVDNPKKIWILLSHEFYLILNVNILDLGSYYRIKVVFLRCIKVIEEYSY